MRLNLLPDIGSTRDPMLSGTVLDSRILFEENDGAAGVVPRQHDWKMAAQGGIWQPGRDRRVAPLKQKIASLTVAAMAIGAVLIGTAQFAGADSASASAVGDKIASIAKAEHRKKIAEPGECDKYFTKGQRNGGMSCARTPWCGAFTRWVWAKAGVKAPTKNPLYATNWGAKKSSSTFKRRGKNKGGNPQPGDVVVYGSPGQSGHVSIVVKVHGNGNIDTVDGNSSNAVRYKKNLNPKTAIAGEDRVHIWGYRKPSGSSSADAPGDAGQDKKADDPQRESDDDSTRDDDSTEGEDPTEDSGKDSTEDGESDEDSDGQEGDEEDSDDSEEDEPTPDDDAPGQIPGHGPLNDVPYQVHS